MTHLDLLAQAAKDASDKFQKALDAYEAAYPCGNPPPPGETERLAALATEAGRAQDAFFAALGDEER
ncbi:hypothetical protein [Acetobacter persici]|uniref:hypothetical protein n=1 Tax=Acetobacter persici TaxID=1076596 RepID=UPI001BA812F0|nr:hypothetical protein [Acetobacter persici]MBS1017033.1 hypothetical protein [Acetobacter persici]